MTEKPRAVFISPKAAEEAQPITTTSSEPQEGEVRVDTVICNECTRSFDVTEVLLKDGLARCPHCGTSYELRDDFDWERFRMVCKLHPSDISTVLQEAIFDLRTSVEGLQGLVQEPINMVMELYAEIHRQRTRVSQMEDAWQTLKNHISNSVADGYEVTPQFILQRMEAMEEAMEE